MQALFDHDPKALQACAMLTKDRSAYDASHDSSFKEVWIKRKLGMFLGSHFNPSATKFTGFLVRHPLYDDGVMLNMVRHAIQSSFSSKIATASAGFILLPNWKGLSANAYMQILREHPGQLTKSGAIPQASVTYCQQELWIETMRAFQLLNMILKLLLYGIKKHNTCCLIGTEGAMQA